MDTKRGNMSQNLLYIVRTEDNSMFLEVHMRSRCELNTLRSYAVFFFLTV
jgi:hypothetical protein